MSDHNQLSGRHLVVGTAGHIDHGKTSLVRALTGVDTDRLGEEKRRGISIELGFASLTLPNGDSISFVDVPGHENFIKNMLAGTTGIHAVLLVVAADEGVKPQTREHFEICRLLDIETGCIALTKCDLATPEQLASARAQLVELSARSFLQGKPVIDVSARTGVGLASLKTALGALVTAVAARDDGGLARLPIDRSFAVKGFGTVVTGTLWSGRLAVADSVVLHPGGLEARIRGLQVHGKAVAHAMAGERTAVNLSGIDHTQATRGMTLTHVNPLRSTSVIDASATWLQNAKAPKRREQMLLHAGTAEIPATIKMLSGDGLARLWLSRPILLLPNDHFVLRRPSPAATVGGGIVLDAFPPARRSRRHVVDRLLKSASASVAERLELLVEDRSQSGLRLEDLITRTGLSGDRILSLVHSHPQLNFLESVGRMVTADWLQRKRNEIVQWLKEFHRKFPAQAGAPLAQARLQLDPAIARAVLSRFPSVLLKGDVVALAEHKPVVSLEQARVLALLEESIRQGGYQPPAFSDVLKQLGTDSTKGRTLLESLIKSQRLVKISDDFVLHADVLQHIRVSLAAHKGRRFSVPDFKEWTQISRKYAIPLLEYLDRQRITRRDGDARIVL